MAKTLQMCSLDVFFCSFTIFSFKLQFAHCYTWSKWMIIFYVMVVMCRTCLSEMPSNHSLIDWLTDLCFCKRVNFQGKLTKLLGITCVELSVWLGVGSKTSIISSVVGSQLPVLYQLWTHHWGGRRTHSDICMAFIGILGCFIPLMITFAWKWESGIPFDHSC